MADFEILAGGYTFKTVYHENIAPETVVILKKHLLGLKSKIIYVHWLGQAGWIPFGDLDLGIGHKSGTCYPPPDEIIIYPGGESETELLIGYGYINFASKTGQLPGNHLATIVEGDENLKALGEKFLWENAQDIELRSLWSIGARVRPASGPPFTGGLAEARTQKYSAGRRIR